MPFDRKTIDDLPLAGKRVLVRVDYNVPLTEKGDVADDRRIAASLPTVRKVLGAPAVAILCSHLGRPDGKPRPKLSLAPVARRLRELLARPVTFVPDCVGPAAEGAVEKALPGDCILLENLRYHAEEEKNDASFAAALARLADFYVDDAFGAAHRAHASVAAVAGLLPAAAGYLLAKEVEVLGSLLENPKRPFVVITGGAKVSDKVPVLRNLLPRIDSLLIGGAMAYTFLRAQGVETGKSFVEETAIQAAREILREADVNDVKVVLPSDHLCIVSDPALGILIPQIHRGAIPSPFSGMDIGPETSREFSDVIGKAGTVFWNGPVGVFEIRPHHHGTWAVAKAMAESGAVTVCGGGDTAAAAEAAGYASRMTHVSTGGGAALELLEGRILPGVAALAKR